MMYDIKSRAHLKCQSRFPEVEKATVHENMNLSSFFFLVISFGTTRFSRRISKHCLSVPFLNKRTGRGMNCVLCLYDKVSCDNI